MFERGKKDGFDKQSGEPERHEERAARPATGGAAAMTTEAGRQGVAVIGRSIRIDGDLQGEEDLRIEGDVNGTIQLRNSTLTIGNEGKVRATVYAKSVAVDGFVEGDVFGAERVTIRKNAQVQGNVTAPRVSLEDGARFKGSIEMDPDAVGKAMGTGSAAKAGSERAKPQSAPQAVEAKPAEAVAGTGSTSKAR